MVCCPLTCKNGTSALIMSPLHSTADPTRNKSLLLDEDKDNTKLCTYVIASLKPPFSPRTASNIHDKKACTAILVRINGNGGTFFP
mmetsp:Transcript_13889/g.21097  ORF Transcript_13889/g.21097 Transcript_13889/m.21097 type:complete len:86 (+) Transcript_13889:448-705(+)